MAICALLASALATGTTRRGADVCARVLRPGTARPGGDDAVLERFIGSLRPGQTGCLRSGTYAGDVRVSSGNIALRPYPGEHARILGRLWLSRSSHDDVLAGLQLDGRNSARLPSPTVNGSRITFTGVDVTTHHTAICFDIGSPTWGRAVGTVIEQSRIHDCGRLPADNKEHGIYVEAADDTRIVSNLIYDNADRGIQLYPDAQHTLIERNVIDGNGEGIIFSGESDVTSSHNVVQHNAITNSQIRADVESWYPPGARIGVGNIVRENCLFGGHPSLGDKTQGFTVMANVVADPQYRNRAKGDFQVPSGSSCATIIQG